ncbi:hypothetical protein [Mucilaginibacter psychrotolerans]|uniref:Uncharacterized protein n=1 Tax=Mucilaginibacter psychrotolerans TaxID=1524096 RepID=A0A4Y8SIN7_9SPHI|nr:hypothetical protein [Mucilaginibacter psychrotolerans]TFF38505.1 hypothetical protein E2R66_08540 [Mucilaginibacter psychrotolerans]
MGDLAAEKIFGIRGNGTSLATPQIADAVYYAKCYEQLNKLSEPFMIVEVIRNAPFSSGRKKLPKGVDCKAYYGNGILQAHTPLNFPVHTP